MFLRMIFGLPGAAVVTALLFLAMGWMIRQDAQPLPPVDPPKFEILAKRKLTQPTTTPKPTPIDQPKPPKIDFPKPSPNPGPTIPSDPLPNPGPGDGGFTLPGGTQPTLRIPPAYPENCRARGAQGIVLVEFDVTAEGAVVNPRVIASENSCLDRAAIQTISKWKYQPQTDSSGRPVPQRGLRQSFNFQLAD
ncbi:MAG: TonB family protein [Pseudomonadota bacterium]